MIQTEKQLRSALPSRDLDKYEYLTGEDPSYRPSTVEEATFDYSPLSKSFNKGLKEEDQKKKEGPLKRLKNIEDKSEEQLKMIKNMNENIKELTNFVKEPLILEAKGLIGEIRIRNMTINEAERKQNEWYGVPGSLSRYSAKKKINIEAKNKLLNNAINFYKGREKVIEGFKNGIFSFPHDDEDSRFEDNDENDI